MERSNMAAALFVEGGKREGETKKARPAGWEAI